MRFETVVASLESLEQPVELRAALRLVEPGGNLHVLRTVPWQGDPAVADVHHALDELRARVDLIVPRSDQIEKLGLHARAGMRVEETARLAVEAQADLIVVSALGAESEAILSHVLQWAACSVLILQPSRESAEIDALAPMFPLCPDCVVTREQSASDWFCASHLQAERRVYERFRAP